MQVLQPAAVAGLSLRNRIVVAPMSRMQAEENGMPAAQAPAYYARFARHGAGLIVTEALYTDDIASRAYFRQPGLANDRQRDAWASVTDAVHEAGGIIVAQLQHAGRLAEPGLNAGHIAAIAGTAAGTTWQTGRPNAAARAATPADIRALIDAFGQAAHRARAAGFDAVEIHGARGYLVNEFLSDTNQRDDEWGGRVENRVRLAQAILASVRSAAGNLPISFNYSLYKMDDVAYQPRQGKAEMAFIAQALRAAGADILHISTRKVLRPEPWGDLLVRAVHEAAPGPLIANGGLASLQDCETAIAQTGASLVSLARPFLANPDWIERCKSGAPLARYTPGMERLPLLGEGGLPALQP